MCIREVLKLSIAIVAVSLFLTVKLYAYDDGDFQIWNTDTEEFKINPDAKITLEEEFRWGGGAKEFYYQHYDVGFFYNFKKYLNVGGGYRHVLSKSQGKFLVENEPYIAATLLWSISGFKFDDRSRLEYNHFDYKKDTWRYRNKFSVKAPWKFTKLEIQPYLSDEIFVLFDNDQKLNTNRFSAGLGMSITKNLKAEIYYMLQSSKSLKWIDTNILGTKLKLTF
ncbi:MAG TPA: DUF2490 domain-containing protein [Candidatus Omnitrophota bacterium]|nr:DUF2490 domain-containing protein [Candidatus Omnitrophota bacterium]HPT38968.1 DUF2490 domain-containing protein [Candidatus Omnitrophota bacterium]